MDFVKKAHFFLNLRPRCIGFARRRMGRGGRVILDRISTTMDDVWSKLDFTIYDSEHNGATTTTKKTNAENGDGDATATETSSVVVDLVTNRKNSIDSVARTTKTLTWSGSENIVIKNEQNNTVAPTTTVKEEKVDDYDSHLGRLSSYSSTLSLGRLSSGIGSQSSIISDVLSQSLKRSNSFNSVPYSQTTLSADRSELLQQRIGELAANIANIKTEQTDADDDLLYGKHDDDQMYSEFLDEIRRDWLHFRPKTPVECADNKNDFGVKPIQYTETTPLAIEIQRLTDEPPSMGLFDSPDDDNHLFVTNPFSLDDIMDDEMQQQQHHHSQHENSLSGTDINLSGSGDSLPELSLSLGETEDNEMLDNILQEVQLDDLKSFNANPNFWNGLLEETAELCEVIDDPKKMSLDVDDRFGIGSMGRKDKRKSHRNQRVGSSTFNLSNLRKDEFFKKEDPSLRLATSNDGNLLTSEINIDKPPSEADAAIKIKEELMDVVVEPQLTIKSENLPVIKTEIVHSTLTMPNVGISKPVNQQQHQQLPQHSLTLTAGDNSLVMQPIGTTPIRRHTNGPTDKAGKFCFCTNLLLKLKYLRHKFVTESYEKDTKRNLGYAPVLTNQEVRIILFPIQEKPALAQPVRPFPPLYHKICTWDRLPPLHVQIFSEWPVSHLRFLDRHFGLSTPINL